MMSFTSWLANLKSASARTRSSSRGRTARNRRSASFGPLAVERLEDRTLLATSLVADVHANHGSWDSPNLTNVNGTLFFTNDDGIHGLELWKSDGTAAGTVMVKDIYPGTTDNEYGNTYVNGSSPSSLTAMGGMLYFTATDDINGRELWKSDGTPEGTVLVQDLYSGRVYGYNGVIYPNSSSPTWLTVVNDQLFFSATDGVSGAGLWKSDGTAAGTKLVRDIYNVYNPTEVNGALFFTANDGVHGQELWKSDGTAAGTVLVKDIYPGSTNDGHGNLNSSNPGNLTAMGGTLFFVAYDDVNGYELWKSDGTETGTVLVHDIYPGSNTENLYTSPNSSVPSGLAVVNGTLFFTATDEIHGNEVWRSDGTSEGTALVKDINPSSHINYGITYPHGSSAAGFTALNGSCYFMADDGVHPYELWKSDGTAQGTVLVKDISADYSSPGGLIAVGGSLLFSADDGINGRELWKTDGTTAGTVLVADINTGRSLGYYGYGGATPNSSYPSNPVNIGGTIFFTAFDSIHGWRLWKSDGIPESSSGTSNLSTTLVNDINTNDPGSSPQSLTLVNGTVFFAANDGVHGSELWKRDAGASPVLVADIYPGVSGSDQIPNSASPSNLTVVNGTVFFRANDSRGSGLWKTDGTEAGTVLVKYITYFDNLTDVNGTLFFRAYDGVYGFELWKSDGTEAGTVLVKDINPTVVIASWGSFPHGSNPQYLTAVGGMLFFSAYDGVHGNELWKSDGTEAGTVLVADLDASPNSSHPGFLTALNGTLFFSASGRMWKSDGTTVGIVLPNVIFSAANLIAVGGTLYFTAYDNVHGNELWKSDGTTEGTVLVKDINPGGFTNDGINYPYGSNAYALTSHNGSIFFSADDGIHGQELWKSDGTADGTVLVKDVNPGSTTDPYGNTYINNSYPGNLTSVSGILFFTADDGVHGNELWKSDGTADGTAMVVELAPGTSTNGYGYERPNSANIYSFTAVGGTLLFGFDDLVHGWELWQSDGTAAGTRLAANINHAVTFDAMPQNLTNVNGTLFYMADDGVHGYELWKSDGTLAGTTLVKDIALSNSSSYPTSLTAVGGLLFFAAWDGTQQELWRSDGTETGTVIIDVYPGSTIYGEGYSTVNSSNPYSLTNVNGTLFFTADDGIHGTELWKSDGTAAGTVLVKDVNPTIDDYGWGTYPIPSNAQNLTAVNGMLYFSADDGVHGPQLWKSDGTEAGTVPVTDINAGGSNPSNLTDVSGMLYFTAYTATTGQQLWNSDGTLAGTVMLTDILTNSFFSSLTAAGETLYFSANDGIHGYELWKSDGTAAGTAMLADIATGWPCDSSYPYNMTAVNGTLFFSAYDNTHGTELWKTDGTTAGTVLVKDIGAYYYFEDSLVGFTFNSFYSSNPTSLVNVNGVLYFAASDGSHGNELWKSDGTEQGTVMVADINSGSFDPTLGYFLDSSFPQMLTAVNGTLFFSATDGAHRYELWKHTDNQPPTASVAGPGTGLAGQVLTFTLGASDSPSDQAAGFVYTVNWGDGTLTSPNVETISRTPGNGASTLVNHIYAQAGSYIVRVTASDQKNAVSAAATWATTITAVTSQNLQSVLTALPPPSPGTTTTITVQVSTSTAAESVISAVNGLAVPSNPIEIVVNLGSESYDDIIASPPAGVTLILNGNGGSTTIVGHSPALLVKSGTVIVTGLILTTPTNSPTIVVTGGKLIIRNSRVEESTAFAQAALSVTGGKVDLGTAEEPGGNTLNVHGVGMLIYTTASSTIPAFGNVLAVNNSAITSGYTLEDLTYHALDAGGLGLVRYTASDVYVTPQSGNIQRAVNAVAAGGTVYVRGSRYADYVAGSKPLTVAFEAGPSLFQHVDSLTGGGLTLTVVGTAGDDKILFTPSGHLGLIDVAVNQLPRGSFAPKGRIVAYGLAGNDDLQVAGSVRVPVELYGGEGNDRIKGGAGNAILVGGAGDDLLLSGTGRNLLIGGAGADRLVGGDKDDLLVAGSTLFDTNEAALLAVLAEWGSDRDYATRVANITGTGQGVSFASRSNGNNFLRVTESRTTTTVFDDGIQDILTGEQGKDLYFANIRGSGVLDKLTDLSTGEIAFDLTFLLTP